MKKKNLRFFIALWAGKLSILLLHILHRKATHFPGELALKICPDFLSRITRPETVVCITGTNGKTTTSNLIGDILRTNGYKIAHNSYGSNTHTGISSTLLENCDLLGRPKAQIALLETDERASVHVLPYIKPDILMVNNLLRDTFKRNAHPGFISWIINRAVPAETKIIYNSDDPESYCVGLDTNERVSFSVRMPDTGSYTPDSFSELPICPACGHELEYTLRRYNHVGLHHCPACGWEPKTPEYILTDVRDDQFSISVNGDERSYKLIDDSMSNIYNFASAVAVLDSMGLSDKELERGFENAHIIASRVKKYEIAGRNMYMRLTKGQSPVAVNSMIKYVCTRDKLPKTLIMMLDDLHDAATDVENTCWIYDCNYETFADEAITRLIVTGARRYDHYVRLMTAGVLPEKVILADTPDDVVDIEDVYNATELYFLYDTFTDSIAEHLREKIVKKITSVEVNN